MADSFSRAGGSARGLVGLPAEEAIALQDGRLRDVSTITRERFANNPTGPEFAIRRIFFELAVKGPSPASAARLDTAIATVPLRDMPMVDRPYLDLAWLLARMGGPEKARAMIGRYRTEMTDTSLRRVQESTLHNALGEIELAEGKPLDAIAEYRRGDVASDGAPASECAGCVAFDVARAYDAARRPDSATVYFERYLATPYWGRGSFELDPIRVPAIRERLGQLYESMGNIDKAIENYRAFIDLWKNADPDLQPRVADARKRLARLTAVEKPRP
jgi:tetratricopeptide (TPR) repeat protein